MMDWKLLKYDEIYNFLFNNVVRDG